MFGQILQDFPLGIFDGIPTEVLLGQTDLYNKFLMTFGKYLRTKTDKVFCHNYAGKLEVVMGNSGLTLNEGHDKICNYFDYPLPGQIQEIEQDELTAYFLSPEFQEKEQKVFSDYAFYAEIAFDVKNDSVY